MSSNLGDSARLDALLDATRALVGAASLDELLDVINDKATHVAEAEQGSIFLVAGSGRELEIRVSGRLERGAVRLPFGRGLAGRAAATGKVVNVREARDDPDFDASIDARTGFHTRSVLCVPVIGSDSELLGVLQVINKMGGDAFGEEDESVLAAFASHVAVAVERARMTAELLEKARLDEGLRIAREVQASLVPSTFPQDDGLDLHGVVQPAQSVSGDFFDIVTDDAVTWFVLGDVSGKGMPAALVMAVARTSFRACVADAPSLADVARRVSDGLCRDDSRGMFVTAFLGRFDPATGELSHVTAGHPPPAVVRPDGTVDVLGGPVGVPLGIVEGWSYEEGRLTLAPGEAVVAFTDGVLEARSASEEEYGRSRLEHALAGAQGRGAQALVEAVAAGVAAFAGGRAPFDDVGLLALARPAP